MLRIRFFLCALVIFYEASYLVRCGLVEITVAYYYVRDPLEPRQIAVDFVYLRVDQSLCLLRRVVRSELSLKDFLVEPDRGAYAVPL